MNGKRGNVAVSFLYGQGKRVHSIRVLTPEGNVFLLDKIKNTEPTTLVASQESNVEPTISTVSNDKIPQTKQNVNIKSSNSSKTDTEYLTAVENGDMETAQRHVDKNVDEILKVTKNWIGEKINHIRKDDIVEFACGNIMYRVGNNGYVADVLVGTRKNGTAVLYDIVNIYDKKITDTSEAMEGKDFQRRQDISVNNNLPQPKQSVNIKSSNSSKTDVGNSFEVYLNLGNVMKPKAETFTNADIKKLIWMK